MEKVVGIETRKKLKLGGTRPWTKKQEKEGCGCDQQHIDSGDVELKLHMLCG